MALVIAEKNRDTKKEIVRRKSQAGRFTYFETSVKLLAGLVVVAEE
jgi:hypothetical protein